MRIDDAFLVTLFRILTERPRMTATEVIEHAFFGAENLELCDPIAPNAGDRDND
jgi:hypothetical protein